MKRRGFLKNIVPAVVGVATLSKSISNKPNQSIHYKASDFGSKMTLKEPVNSCGFRPWGSNEDGTESTYAQARDRNEKRWEEMLRTATPCKVKINKIDVDKVMSSYLQSIRT